jgi:hypothetical protein
MGMGGAITAVAATITVGTAATTMAGAIIAIGGDFHDGHGWPAYETKSPGGEPGPWLSDDARGMVGLLIYLNGPFWFLTEPSGHDPA